jgi:hypothetical protein
MRLEVHSEAREEFLQAVSFYDAQVPGLGLRFITEIDRCQKALLEAPLIGSSLRQAVAEIHGWRHVSLLNRVHGSRGCFICIGVRSWLTATRLLASTVRQADPLTIGWSDRGSRFRWAKEGVDDWDKVPSIDAGEAPRPPRRSTSSLGACEISRSERLTRSLASESRAIHPKEI